MKHCYFFRGLLFFPPFPERRFFGPEPPTDSGAVTGSRGRSSLERSILIRELLFSSPALLSGAGRGSGAKSHFHVETRVGGTDTAGLGNVSGRRSHSGNEISLSAAGGVSRSRVSRAKIIGTALSTPFTSTLSSSPRRLHEPYLFTAKFEPLISLIFL